MDIGQNTGSCVWIILIRIYSWPQKPDQLFGSRTSAVMCRQWHPDDNHSMICHENENRTFFKYWSLYRACLLIFKNSGWFGLDLCASGKNREHQVIWGQARSNQWYQFQKYKWLVYRLAIVCSTKLFAYYFKILFSEIWRRNKFASEAARRTSL